MTVTVMKTHFKKCSLKIIIYRDYKHFVPAKFRAEMEHELCNYHGMQKTSNDEFVNILMEIFEKHVPIRYKYVRANDLLIENKKITEGNYASFFSSE